MTYEGRSSIVDRLLDPRDPVVLEREPRNQFDSNAVAVRLRTGEQIGYVPARYARDMAPLLDGGARYLAWCKKILLGAHASIPVVVASLGAAVHGTPTRLTAPAQRGMQTAPLLQIRRHETPPATAGRSIRWPLIFVLAAIFALIAILAIAGR